MKKAKAFLLATSLAVAAAGAFAQQDTEAWNSASMSYSVDEDRDGRSDREIYLDQSDALA